MRRWRVDPEGLLTIHVARALQCSPGTAVRVIDTLLPHRRERLAGQRSRRRVRAADLRRLMEEWGAPTSTLDELLR